MHFHSVYTSCVLSLMRFSVFCIFSGFIRGLPQELATSVSFKVNFDEGSLLTVVCYYADMVLISIRI